MNRIVLYSNLLTNAANRILLITILALFLVHACGCGTTTKQSATEQLLVSDAIDEAVSQIDFRHLSGRDVFLDTTHLRHVKSIGFVNADYIISSIRQQLTAARCSILDRKEDADIVVEPRVGALGTDGQDITFGIPQSNQISATANALGSTIPIPVLPEISFGRSASQSGIAKLIVYAYDRETRQPVWQSGIARAESTSRNTWLFGAGPIQRGTIYKGVRFAGSGIGVHGDNSGSGYSVVDYRSQHVFPAYGPVPDKIADKSDTEKK